MLKKLTFLLFACLVSGLFAENLWHRKAVQASASLRAKGHLDTGGNAIDRELEDYFKNWLSYRELQRKKQGKPAQKKGRFSFFNQKGSGTRLHIVRRGETVWSISQKYKVSPKLILESNTKLKRRPLYINEKLFIPTAKKDRKHQSGRTVYHKVKKGESLYGIARKYKVSLAHLQKWNRIKTAATIGIGQRLKIKKSGLGIPRGYRREKLFQWPLRGRITSAFGRRANPFLRSRVSYHKGIDIAAKVGTRFRSSRDGVVVRSKRMGGYGNCIFLLHEDEYISIYAHNKKNLVKKGQVVRKGEVIGLVGRTGTATGPHLHFEVRKFRKPINPLRAFKMNRLVKVSQTANQTSRE